MENYNKKLDLVKQLQICWKNEKFSKDLLKYNTELIETILQIIEQREEDLNSDIKKSEEKDIIELELERIKFVLKDYLRIRLAKIEKYLYYLIKNEVTDLLSKNEFDFAVEMKKGYFNDGIYKKINLSFNDFKQNQISNNIVVAPPKLQYVIARAKSQNTINCRLQQVNINSMEIVDLSNEEIACIPYDVIKTKIETNEIELI